MDFSDIGKLIGGLGLFLIGLRLLTEGLQTSAGKTLRGVLRNTTGTPLRCVMTGTVLTAILQSSSATTVAIIGFVNAGLIKLRQAIAIIYGTNVGTTMTAWLVALVGINIEIKTFALPLIGMGAFMRISSKARTNNAAGDILSGFGVFFIGLEIMKNAFANTGATLHIPSLTHNDLLTLFLCVAIGTAITFIFQSSSAAIALIITAAGGDVVTSMTAAALIIGANVGTTSTALFAVIGATAAAKRVAAAHILFNIATGAVALLFLPFFYSMMAPVESLIGLTPSTVSELALFHTCFNILGVLLFFPLTRPLTTWLKKRFQSPEDQQGKPLYLDKTLLGTPLLAIHALCKELSRLDEIAHSTARRALDKTPANERDVATGHFTTERLTTAIARFCTDLQRSRLPVEQAEMLPVTLRISRYLITITDLAEQITAERNSISQLTDEKLSLSIRQFQRNCSEQLKPFQSTQLHDLDFSQLQEDYQQLKSTLLKAGAYGKLDVQRMVIELDIASKIHRSVEQSGKARHYLSMLKNEINQSDHNVSD